MLAAGFGMAKLIFIGDKFAGRVYEFALEKTTVGRGDHNTLTILDASVSQSHCEVLVYGTEVIVRDLGSSNGTSVNGVRLYAQQRPLLAGQVVKFGSVEARLELQSPTTGDTATDITAIRSHARYLREQEPAPQSAPAAMTLETGLTSAPEDHTLLLPRAQPAEEGRHPSPLHTAAAGQRSSRPVVPAVIVAAIVVGLAVLCWWMLTRNR
jgi:predicted component of type VI protein secretion system